MASIITFLIIVTSPLTGAAINGLPEGVSRMCGSDVVGYLRLHDGYSVFVNGERIDDMVYMCEALAFYFASRCLKFDCLLEEWGKIGITYCGWMFEHSTALNCDDSSERKILEVEPSNLVLLRRKDLSMGEGKYFRIYVQTKSEVLKVPGLLFLSCLVFFPCFRAKRKKTIEQKDLARELNSLDSVSPLNTTASPDKNPTIHKLPLGPSRFQLSPLQNQIGSLQLSINQIIKATQNFSPSLKLGEGGFGTVYKGFLDDGQVVAIKRAKKEYFMTLQDEFSSEVELLAKIEHRSLVRLLGYTEKGNERIIIAEYVPNGTLREHLDGLHGIILDFNQRLEVAIDVAHALTYLHLYAEKMIIHRDVKASNILLTETFRAKVSDFGFARTGPTEAGQTHISTQVKGTAGYLDPEYLRTYQLTPKSDVFSFGILLIEILSARRPVEMKRSIDERITIRWAFKMFNEGSIKGVLDPKLQEDVSHEVLSKMLSLAFHCAAPTRANRPLMKEVGEQLWEIRKDFGKSIRIE